VDRSQIIGVVTVVKKKKPAEILESRKYFAKLG